MVIRPLLPILLTLPCAAGLIGDIAPGDKEKDVLRKAAQTPVLAPTDAKAAKHKLVGTYRLADEIASQQWQAVFEFDRRSKELASLVFIGDQSYPADQYDSTLKSFYLYTAEKVASHFGLGSQALNTPDYGSAKLLKADEMRPLHAFQGGGSLLTMGVRRDKKGAFHVCFSVKPVVQTALGSTAAENTSGNIQDWTDVPKFETLDAGKSFLASRGVKVEEPAPTPATDKGALAAQVGETSGAPLGDTSRPVVQTTVATGPAVKVASTQLPQVEQDMLNALILMDAHRNKDAMEKLVAAGKAGNPRAFYELACCYAQGLYGVEANAEKAEKAFRQAALGGYALAMVRYGAEFSSALAALKLDAAAGEELLSQIREGARVGTPSVRFNLGVMLRYGYGVRKDVATALSIMERLAFEGDPAAAKLAEEWKR